MIPRLSLALFAPAPDGGGSALLPLLVQFALIFAIFYFLMIRPQQKQRKQHEERLKVLKKGDAVVTAGGIIGEVVAIKQPMKDGQPAPTLDDAITIKSGESRFIVERGRIARVTTGGETTAP